MRRLWSVQYRGHTCYKAFSDMLPNLQPGCTVQLKSAEFPPCRVCRAWWAQACARFGVSIDAHWPAGHWSEHASRPRSPHNRLLQPPYVDGRGMLVVAEENQRCALWGYLPNGAGHDPEVFQTDLGDQVYGPWYPTGLSETEFLSQFRLWNQANGGAAVTVFGEESTSTRERLALLPVALDCADFRVYASASAHVAVAGDRDIYIWGPHEHVVRATTAQLALAWDDLEA